MTTFNDPRAPTRKELSKFLPDQRSVKAFEKLFDLIPKQINNINDEIGDLQNPPTVLVSTNYNISTDALIVVVQSSGITLYLPKCAADLIGAVWYISFPITGSVTIETNPGDYIATPDNPAETSIVLNRRGSVIGLRCISTNEWIFS